MALKPDHPVVRFEEKTFREANIFTVTEYKPFGQSKKTPFKTYPEALAEAERDTTNRPPLIYASTPAGRSVAIGKTERLKFLALWNRTH